MVGEPTIPLISILATQSSRPKTLLALVVVVVVVVVCRIPQFRHQSCLFYQGRWSKRSEIFEILPITWYQSPASSDINGHCEVGRCPGGGQKYNNAMSKSGRDEGEEGNNTQKKPARWDLLVERVVHRHSFCAKNLL